MRRSTQDGSPGESGNSEANVVNGVGQLVSSGSHDKSVAGDNADDVTVIGPYDSSREDYLELNDLHSLGTTPASSDNSSRVSVNSDDNEYFDAEALLREIGNDTQMMRDENADCKLSISTPAEPNHVVITMPPSGSVIRNDNPADKKKRASTSLSANVPILRSRSEGSLAADQKVNSSNSGSRSSGQGSPKTISRIAKLGKKYFCFGSF